MQDVFLGLWKSKVKCVCMYVEEALGQPMHFHEFFKCMITMVQPMWLGIGMKVA
jgi:hypothetical protein